MHVVSSAAPLGTEPQKRFQALISPTGTFTQLWGLTEATPVAASFWWDEHDATGSVGRMKPNIDLKIVDDANRDISSTPGARGEFCIRGPGVILGYLGGDREQPVNRSDWDEDGYFHTGDVGYRDANTGLLYLVDRKKEMIKVRGFQVAPAELEAVLSACPGIADAAVIGIKDEAHATELPRAYVVRQLGESGTALTASQIQQFLAARLASYKRLDGGVVFVDVIPKNASGKILKRVLRDHSRRDEGAKL